MSIILDNSLQPENKFSNIHKQYFQKQRKKVPKSIENSLKIDLWALLGTPVGATLEPLGKHLGHMLPKDWILEAPGTVLGAQNCQLGSNLEAQDPPKSMQKHEKLDIKE